MSICVQLARQIREVYSGGNWTGVNLKDTLSGVTWEQAIQKVASLNTIAALVYHIDYFVAAILPVLEGKPLDAHDKFSFDHPPVTSPPEWDALVATMFANAERLAQHVEQFPEERLWTDFWEKKYGSWYRNITGIIEHTHYHLGQIVVVRKMVG